MQSQSNQSNPSKEMMKILHLKLVMLLECQNIKLFLRKAKFQIGLKKFLFLLQRFTKNNCKKQIKKTTMERLR